MCHGGKRWAIIFPKYFASACGSEDVFSSMLNPDGNKEDISLDQGIRSEEMTGWERDEVGGSFLTKLPLLDAAL